MGSVFAPYLQQAKDFALQSWGVFLDLFDNVYDTLMDWRLLTSGEASLIILIVVAFFFLPIIYGWFRSRSSRTLYVELGFLAIPLALLLLLQVPRGFVGSPDDNCTSYQRGKMSFSLIAYLVEPKKSSDIYGDAWLILLVQNERWGDDLHQCRISLTDPKAQVLRKVMHDSQGDQTGGRFHRGEFTFTFGGRHEIPNAVIKAKQAFKKPYPPEQPHAVGAPVPASSPQGTQPNVQQ